MKITIDTSRPKVKRAAPNLDHKTWLKQHKNILILAALIVTAGLAFGVLTFINQDRASKNLTDSKVARIKRQVAAHYILPKDEEPALATVEDTTKLTTPFLKQSENGDEILIYQKASLAIIYRPTADRIVAVGPVAIDTPKTPKDSK